MKYAQHNLVNIAARLAHEANRVLQDINQEEISAPWGVTTQENRDSTSEGVLKSWSGNSPEQLHESWSTFKRECGWVYGEVKDEEKKTHPCLVPYSELPEDQRLKDFVFQGITKSIQDFERSTKDETSNPEPTPPRV